MTRSLSADSVVVPVPDVHVVAMDGEKVLFTPASGALHHLDRTAALVWDCLLPPAPVEDVVADLAQAFDADQTQVEADVLDLLDQLLHDGALVRSDAVEDLPRDT